MKKTLLTLLLLNLMVLPVFANEQNLEQKIDNENSYLGVNFEKKPTSENGGQLIKNHKSFLIINIVINGKIKESNNK